MYFTEIHMSYNGKHQTFGVAWKLCTTVWKVRSSITGQVTGSPEWLWFYSVFSDEYREAGTDSLLLVYIVVIFICLYKFMPYNVRSCKLIIKIISILRTYLLTYFMVQSPSWEANFFAASQEIPRISQNPKVHYRTHKHPPPVPILGQPNPVYIPTSQLLEIYPNIIHPSTPRSPQWSISLQYGLKIKTTFKEQVCWWCR